MKKCLITVLLVCVTFLFTLFGFAPFFYHQESVIIPNVLAMDLPNAQEMIEEKNLFVSVKYIDSKERENTVIKTLPGSGNIVKEGQVVQLVLSNGKEAKRMIKVTQMYYEDALVELAKYDVDIETVYVYDELYPANYILKQYPLEGHLLDGQVVVFVNEEREYLVMPNMLHWKTNEVEKYAQSTHINIVFEYVYNARVRKGHVVGQSIESGTKIIPHKQNVVIVSVSLGPDLTYIPDIIDFSLDEATTLLDKLGIVYTVSYVASNAVEDTVLETYKEVMNGSIMKLIVIASGGMYEERSSD